MGSLRGRLTLSYVLVALLCVLLVSALANGVLESEFRRYVSGMRREQSRQVADLVSGQLRADGTWDEDGLAAVGMNALEQGMIVRVQDAAGAVVWDATSHNSGLCEQMISHMAANMASRYPNWQGGLTEAPFPVAAGPREAGLVFIGTYGPFFLDDQDLAFITALNRLLLWVTLAVLALAVGVGLFMARGISVPIARVVSATQAIAAGRRDVRISEKSRMREIAALTGAVNGLSQGLRDQEELRRRLTADLAHELRTPLAALQGHVEALVDGVWQPDADRLAGLHEEVLRITRLVKDLERLAREESAAVGVAAWPTDLSVLLGAIVTHHQPLFGAKGVSLSAAVPPGLAAEVDPDRLSQAVVNLLSNALEFTAPGGTVAVTAAARASAVEIAVADTGIGIAADDLPRIFERLSRVDPSRSRQTGGAGIGLAITRAIVEAHGGTIRAESRTGKGSVFTIRIPLRSPRGD
jgi:signal transduction histidine kinase